MTTMSTSHEPSAGPRLVRVHPAPAGPTTPAEAYDAHRRRPDGRPWVGVCMVTSLDGSVVLDGTSGGLGNANDREVLLTLRRVADVVVVGAATARGEGYGPPGQAGRRIGVVTNSGRVDPTSPLFASGAGFVITAESTDVPSGVEVLRAGAERVDLPAAFARLGEVVPDVAHVHAEGGPTLNGALLAADLIDELDLTVAPTLVGGDGPRVTANVAQLERRFDLAHLLVDDEGYTFGRWIRQ